MSTVPMISPDGQIGDVPQEHASAAVAKGFKMGQDMLAPTGEPGVIPFDQVHAAMGKGFQLAGSPAAQAPGAPSSSKNEPKPEEMSGWDKARSAVASFFNLGSKAEADQLHQHAAESDVDQSDEGLHAHEVETANEYAKSFGFAAGGGLTKIGAKGAAEIAVPVLKRVAEKLFGTSTAYKAFVDALHGEAEAESAVEEVAHGEPAPSKVPAKTVRQSQALGKDAPVQQQAEALKTANTPEATPESTAEHAESAEGNSSKSSAASADSAVNPTPELKAQGKDEAEKAFLKNLGKSKADVSTAQQKAKLAYQKHLTQQAVKGKQFGPRGGVTPELLETAKAAGRKAYLKHLGLDEFALENAKSAARQGYMAHLKKSMAELTAKLQQK